MGWIIARNGHDKHLSSPSTHGLLIPMKTVIIGAGQVGYNLAEQLVLEKRDVVLIERDPTRAEFASAHLDCMVIRGEGNNMDDIRQAGTADADFFVAATDSDEVNIISCFLVGAEFERPTRIARVRNLAYLKTKMFANPHLGIDFVVNQETEAAKAIINTVRHGATTDVTVFENTKMELRKLFVDHRSFFRNKSLKKIKSSIEEPFLVAGIIREGDVIIPTGNTQVLENDHIYLAATEKSLETVLHKVGKVRSRLQHIVIVGGSAIGQYVAGYLAGQGYHIKLVDRDPIRCRELAESLPSVLVLHGDISDEGIFQDEQLGDSDLIITTTDNEELNILAAVYAKSQGAHRALSLVSKANYLTVAANLGIDATVSPKLSSVNTILRFLRRGNVRSVQTLFDGKTEVIEFTVTENSDVAGMALKDIRIPKNALILAVRRPDLDIIPDGNTNLNPGDVVMTFTKKNAIDKLERLFLDSDS